MFIVLRLKIFGYTLFGIAILLAMFSCPPASIGLFPLSFFGAWLAKREIKKLEKEIKQAKEEKGRQAVRAKWRG